MDDATKKLPRGALRSPAKPSYDPPMGEQDAARSLDEASWVGRIIAEHYQVEGVLGVGGMGIVVRARDLRLKRLVAIKLILPEYSRDRSLNLRLALEAQITANLSHPNIVQVHAFGESGGQPFFVLEHLEGNTLAEELEYRMYLPSQIPGWMIGILRGLATAHDDGIIHRDVKPQNAFLAREGTEERPKLLDFGIAKEQQATLARSGITRRDTVIGSGRYMSPEQTDGPEGLDARTDVWSAGVMLYEMLVDDSLWHQPSWGSLMKAISSGPIADVRQTSRWPLPKGLAEVVDRALARDRNARFRDAVEMLAAFEKIDFRVWDSLRLRDARPPTQDELFRKLKREESWLSRSDGQREIPSRMSIRRWLNLAQMRRVPAPVTMAVRLAVSEGANIEYDHFLCHLWVGIRESGTTVASRRALAAAGFVLEDARFTWQGGAPFEDWMDPEGASAEQCGTVDGGAS